MLVSIVIPNYNSAAYLQQCLESALGQTYSTLEVLLVDDGSNDASLEVARKFRDHRLQILTTPEPGSGASASRNVGMAAAQGEYFQFLDSDDFLEPRKLEYQLAALRYAPANSLSYGPRVDFFDGQDALAEGVRIGRGGAAGKHEAQAPEDPVEFLIHLWGGEGPKWMVQTGQWLTSRCLADRAGAWDESVWSNNDGEYFCRVVLASERVLYCDEALAYYRKFAKVKSLSSKRSALHMASRLKSFDDSLERLRAHTQANDPRVHRCACNLYNALAEMCYPEREEITRQCEERLAALGETFSPQPLQSELYRALAHIIGWKGVMRWRHAWQQKLHPAITATPIGRCARKIKQQLSAPR